MSYVCVLPVRDGEEHIAESIDSLLAQIVKPTRIYVIDDGSTDRTPEILKGYSDETVQVMWHESTTRDYIRIAYLYKLATDEIAKLPSKPDYLFCASDDAKFPPDYAQQLIDRMKADSRLVIASGDFGERVAGDKAPQGTGRLFNYEYYTSVGGFPLWLPGWETWILHKALMDGKKIKNFQDIRFEHTRPYSNGSIESAGNAMYCLGYTLPSLIATFLYNLRDGKFMGRRQSFLLLAGYLRAMINAPVRASREFREAISRDQNVQLVRFIGSLADGIAVMLLRSLQPRRDKRGKTSLK